jgi:hypothetical protein
MNSAPNSTPMRDAEHQRPVAHEQADTAMRRPCPDQQRRACRAQAGLKNRRDAGIGELDRHLIETPACAQQHHHCDGGRIELLAAAGGHGGQGLRRRGAPSVARRAGWCNLFS